MSTVQKVDRALRGLELNDKIGALICHLCERNVDAIAAIVGLLATAEIIGKNLPDEFDRRRCAMTMRDCATEVEAEHQPISEQ